MLVLTRRAGESIRIGDDIEILIVAVDGTDLAARCAISISDDEGNEVPLRHTKPHAGTTLICKSD
jgi:hypothetical protein